MIDMRDKMKAVTKCVRRRQDDGQDEGGQRVQVAR